MEHTLQQYETTGRSVETHLKNGRPGGKFAIENEASIFEVLFHTLALSVLPGQASDPVSSFLSFSCSPSSDSDRRWREELAQVEDEQSGISGSSLTQLARHHTAWNGQRDKQVCPSHRIHIFGRRTSSLGPSRTKQSRSSALMRDAIPSSLAESREHGRGALSPSVTHSASTPGGRLSLDEVCQPPKL